MQRRAVSPEALTCGVAVSLRIKRPQHQQTLRPVCAMLRQADLPGVATTCVALSVC